MTRRVILVLASVAVVLLVALEVPLAVSFERQRTSELTTELQRDALAVGDTVEDALEVGAPLDASRMLAAYQRDTGGRVLIVDRNGVGLADSDPTEGVGPSVGRSFASRPEIAAALTGQTGTATRHSQTLGETLVVVAVPVRSGDRILGAVRISHARSDVDAAVRHYQLALVVIALVILSVALGLGYAVGRWASRPLRNVQHAAAALGDGDLAARAQEGVGPPEVQDLAVRFNQMAGRLGRLIEASQVFATDASHQLRTPLTALRLRVDNLSSSARGARELAPLLVEIDRLERIIDGLLALGRADREPTHPVAVPLAALCHRCVDTWQAAADGLQLRADVDPDLYASFDPDHLEQVLDNLVANAIDAVPAGSAIEITAVPRGRTVEVHVTDHGPGMTPGERVRALERHWHQRPGGTGLGLAIVQRLCQQNNATIRLDETPGGGLDAVVVAARAPRPDRQSEPPAVSETVG